ncbi:hypothetical protein CBR_g50085 [Chara braunii]|uniref:Protein kinase domain-containing protein n=1 Tax=Chara braunii TaxID=69332 RepID=A0A388M5Y3_CHABU|nr:hypothetical protein CBR_g50085 [Chara braunii]|eukprot:GBG89994.1 hypothetical protein CBR_g50085 [Chara braunii]
MCSSSYGGCESVTGDDIDVTFGDVSGDMWGVCLQQVEVPLRCPGNGTHVYNAVVRDIVFDPNGTTFYYILDERCILNETITHLVQSIRKADRKDPSKAQLLSYGWPAELDNLTRPPVVDLDTLPPGSADIAAAMSRVVQMDLSPSALYLIISVNTMGRNESALRLVSTTTGYRGPISLPDKNVYTWAFGPDSRRMYTVDDNQPEKLFSIAVDDSGRPVNMSDFAIAKENLTVGGSSGELSKTVLSTRGLAANCSCLYFHEQWGSAVWGADLNSPDPATMVDRLLDNEEPSFQIRDVAVTSDGCNVFATDNKGSLWWVRTHSPCGRKQKKSPMLPDPEVPPFWGLALREKDDTVAVYVGTEDGRLFELEIFKSDIRCAANDGGNGTSMALRSDHIPTVVRIVSTVVAGVLLIVGLVLVFRKLVKPLARYRSGRKSLSKLGTARVVGSPQEPSDSAHLRQLNLIEFELEVLAQSTENFSQHCRVGKKRGSFGGEVYMGCVDKEELAIKVMTANNLTESRADEFRTAVADLGRCRHSHLADLIGYSHQGNRFILVYPYFLGGSLYSRLHEHAKRRRPLLLHRRLSVAFQVSKALGYLHTCKEEPVIHGNLKSSNILLSNSLGDVVHVAVDGYGLSAMAEQVFSRRHDEVVRSAQATGSLGYMSPEYLHQGKRSEKSDVYAFGVLLLELLTGRQAVTRTPSCSATGWQTLVDWVKPFLTANVADVAMPYVVLDSSLRHQAANAVARELVMGLLDLAAKGGGGGGEEGGREFEEEEEKRWLSRGRGGGGGGEEEEKVRSRGEEENRGEGEEEEEKVSRGEEEHRGGGEEEEEREE